MPIWTLTDGAEYHTLRTRGVPRVIFSPDDRHVVSSTRNGSILLWDILNRGTSVLIKDDAKHVASITFSSEGRLVGWIFSNFLQIWNTATRKAVSGAHQDDRQYGVLTHRRAFDGYWPSGQFSALVGPRYRDNFACAKAF